MRTIDVLGVPFTIVYANLEKDGVYGDCEPLSQTIRIDNTIPIDHQQKVLAHELTHAALRISGLNELVDDKIEEAICVLMETAYKVYEDVI